MTNRNKFAMVETKSVYFDFDKAALRDEGVSDIEEVAKALKADPNAVVELQGFADARGAERYNYQLTRERVDATASSCAASTWSAWARSSWPPVSGAATRCTPRPAGWTSSFCLPRAKRSRDEHSRGSALSRGAPGFAGGFARFVPTM